MFGCNIFSFDCSSIWQTICDLLGISCFGTTVNQYLKLTIGC